LDTECAAQRNFSFRHDRETCLDFEGGEITSDAGLVALRELDHRIGFTESLVACAHDDRHPPRFSTGVHTVACVGGSGSGAGHQGVQITALRELV